MTDDATPTPSEAVALCYADRVANWQGLAADIDAVIRAAVADEREACAKMALDADIWVWAVTDPVRYCDKAPNHEADSCDWEREIRSRVAAAIRARGPT
jgi:hypothetical protein